MRFIAFVALSLLCAPAQAQVSVRVHDGDWGTASVADIQAVLGSVAEVLAPDLHVRALRIVVRPSSRGPKVLAEKAADGAHQVLLDVRDTRWDQFAYQFSHELCHIASNYEQRPIADERPHQWFEESVCEAVSLVALKRLSLHWQTRAPHPAWAPYAPAFAEYAKRVLSSEPREPASAFPAWYRANAAAMASDPYLRHKNRRVAHLLVDIFSRSGLQAVAYLNMHTPGRDDFPAFLAAWHDCCPEAQRAVVRRLLELFQA